MNCIEQHHGEGFSLYHGDACEVTQALPDNSLDFVIYSPPFINLYIYSDSLRDMGNCASDGEFFEHYDFLVPQLLRATRPGRLCAVHCKDLVNYKGSSGRAGLRDFPGELIRSHERHGWQYHSRVTIWKDPVTEMQRTKAHGLLHKQLCKDSTFSRQGLPDYLLLFRKWADEENESEVVPVAGGNDSARFTDYVGTSGPMLSPDEARDGSIKVWQRYASPVWFDIDPMNVLNIQQARANEDEKHICPLQLDVIERAVHLWSNPGDVVFSPFAGIGSELVGAMRHKRKALGVELKPEYYRAAIKHCQGEVLKQSQGSLFDLMEVA